MTKANITLITLLIMSLSLVSCNNQSLSPYSETHFALGTVCSITLYEKNKKFNFDDAFKVIDKLEQRMSPVIKDSEVDQINQNAGIHPVKISDDTFFVIKEAIRYSELKKSKFDITIGPLVDLWGIGTEDERIPDIAEIKNVLPLINSSKIKLNNKDRTVFLLEKGMAIDLGGIAKGYASDRVKDFLINKGFTKGIVNLGGNVLTFGKKAPKTPWKIGIQNPLDSRGSYLGTLAIGPKAVVTSGIYERFFIQDRKRYHHILDPVTGYPVDNNLLSITIVTARGVEADAYSTVAFSEGLQKGMDLLESEPEIEGIFITKGKNIYISSGLTTSFTLMSGDYTIIPQ